MNMLPCVDCITLSLCKSQYRDTIFGHYSYARGSFIIFRARNKLTSKCILLDNYVYKDWNADYNTKTERREELHNFMMGIIKELH